MLWRLVDLLAAGLYAQMLKRGRYVAWVDRLQAWAWKRAYWDR